MLPAGERRWKITDVVGAEDGLGVECLSGSGAIASIYARAFKEGFTLTLVSGRTVGIGAYLARLGRRCASGPQAEPWALAASRKPLCLVWPGPCIISVPSSVSMLISQWHCGSCDIRQS